MELKQITFRIKISIWYRIIKKLFGMPVTVRHFMIKSFIIVALNKFDTLIL